MLDISVEKSVGAGTLLHSNRAEPGRQMPGHSGWPKNSLQ
jgi:hypothetical protein